MLTNKRHSNKNKLKIEYFRVSGAPKASQRVTQVHVNRKTLLYPLNKFVTQHNLK